jgi:glucosamine-6-phosphate deaminase
MKEAHILRYDQLTVEIHPTSQSLGETAAEYLIGEVNALLASEPAVHIIFATGNSMLGFYDALRRRAAEVDWQRVRIFHMDEYVGMTADHPASFRRYLHAHIISHLQPLAFYEVIGDAPDSQQECDRYAALLRQYPPHICCLGIGENGHIAFNDPPYADFDDPLTVKVVRLAEQSRRQQVGEGHFASLAEVPQDAITLTIPALLAPACVIGIVPEARKAQAVKTALEGPISEDCPASILRETPQARLLLDVDSAGLLALQE